MVHTNKMAHPRMEKLDFLRMNLQIVSHLNKGVQIVKPSLTLFVEAFVAFIWCGDQNFYTRVKVNSNERRGGCKGEFGEDIRNKCNGWKQ